MMNKKKQYRAGIDLGGTKIEICLLNKVGEAVFRHRVPTPRTGDRASDYTLLLTVVADLVQHTTEAMEISVDQMSIGMGIPGILNSAGKVKNANSVFLNGMPLKDDLEKHLSTPIRIANDANCFALSEAINGAAAHANVVFGVILGTGVGGGLVIDRKVNDGINAIGGEWGHNPLPWPDLSLNEWPGSLCYCGRTSCIETWVSGTGLAADYKAHTGIEKTAHTIYADLSDSKPSVKQAAEDSISRFERRLAKSLATVINLVDPQVIVLGGGLSKMRQLYDHIPKIWTEYVFSDSVKTALLPPVYGDSSGVRGAAWLWSEDLL